MYITEPLHRLIIAAQLAASVNALYAILPLLISLGFVADARGTVSPLWSLFALGGFYLVTSVALFVLAVYMGRAKIWAYVATWIVAALLAVQIVIDIGIFFHLAAGEEFLIRQFTCCGLTHLPHLLLAVAALNSVEEIHSAVRQRRRERLAKPGAAAVPTHPLPPPPPPARDHPLRRASTRNPPPPPTPPPAS